MPVAVKETATFGVSMFLKNIGKAKTSDPIKEDITVGKENFFFHIFGCVSKKHFCDSVAYERYT